MGKVVSIIIPVYNVEPFIRRCLDSVMNQTYKDLEIIIIDDGSQDNSGYICDEYSLYDSRISVIHQINKGLSATRNEGLKRLTGDYLFFIDSDDYILPDTIERLVKKMHDGDYDIVACGIEMVWDRSAVEKNRSFTCDVSSEWSGRDSVMEMQFNNNICSVVWNKLYKSYLWKDIYFPIGKLHEDEFTTYKLLYKATKVAFIPDTLYKYYQRETGISAGMTNDDRDDHLEAFLERYEFFAKLNESELAEWSMVKYLDFIKYLYRNTKSRERKKGLSVMYKGCLHIMKCFSHISLQKKMGLIIWNYLKY